MALSPAFYPQKGLQARGGESFNYKGKEEITLSGAVFISLSESYLVGIFLTD
jgi:hypothetical protein